MNRMTSARKFPTGPITLSELCTAYGVANNMGALRGLTSYNVNGVSTIAPQTQINLNSFRGKFSSNRTIIIKYVLSGSIVRDLDQRTLLYTGSGTARVDYLNLTAANGTIVTTGDNRGSGCESVLIYVNKFLENYPSMTYLKVDLNVGFSASVGDMNLYYYLYDGGITSIINTYEYTNTGGTLIFSRDRFVSATRLFSAFTYLGEIEYNLTTYSGVNVTFSV